MKDVNVGSRVRTNVPGEINHDVPGVVIEANGRNGRVHVDLGHIRAWYSPAELVSNELPAWVQGHRLAKLGKDPDAEGYDAEPELVDRVEDAEVLTSWTGRMEEPPTPAGPNDWSALAHQPETYHRPILDLDFDAHLVPSTSADHHHLYLDKVLTWSDYVKLLDCLAAVGIIEPGYRDASIAREFTAVRLPWIAKELPKGPAPEVDL